MTDEIKSMTRAEWIAAAAMGVNVLGFAFGGGALWQMVNDHNKRLTAVEAVDRTREVQMTQILVRLERIDANTIALKERVEMKP